MNGLAMATMEVVRPPSLVESFDSVWILDANLSAEHWKYMWQRYSVSDLIDIGRRSGWYGGVSNQDAIVMLIDLSRSTGYDPIQDGLAAETPIAGM